MGVTRLINGMQSQLEKAQVTTQPVDVVVALTMLAQGKPIAVEDLAIMTITTDFLPDHAVTDPEAVVGRVARTRILPYETIRTERLAEATTGGGLNAIIPKGMRAVSINVSEGSAVAGFLSPGNYVDVLVTIQPHEGEPTTVTVLQAIYVLGVNARYGDMDLSEQDDMNFAPSVTLAITPAQAEKLTHASVEGVITLTLRNDIDVTLVDSHGTTDEKLIGSPAIKTTPPAPQNRSASTPEKQDQRLIIRGAQTEQQNIEQPNGATP